MPTLPPAAARLVDEALKLGARVELTRSGGAVEHARLLERFSLPDGEVWMLEAPRRDGRLVALQPDEPLTGHLVLGPRVLRFEATVVTPRASYRGTTGEKHFDIALITAPAELAEVQRRQWFRAPSEAPLLGAATLLFEGVRVVRRERFYRVQETAETEVEVLDLSGGGVAIQVPDRFAYTLDQGELVRLTIDADGAPFGFAAKVCNSRKTEGGIRYGLAFFGEDRILDQVRTRALRLVFRLQELEDEDR
jgi:c-di-GMP-binding flagellar brake protein YcgR